MKMNIRPVTVLLLIIMLVVGVNAGLYHFGMLDSFLAKMDKKSISQEGEGPVVRKEISNLTLPLKSSSSASEMPPAEGMTETDIPRDNTSATEGRDDLDVTQKNASVDANNADAKVIDSANGSTNYEIKSVASSIDKPGTKVAAKPAAKANVKKITTVVRGDTGLLKNICSTGKLSVQIPLSTASGRITWFNLQTPRKLVVDLHGKWANKGKSLYRLKNCGIDKIVLGEHADKLRMVFYISKNDAPKRLTPTIVKSSKGIILDLKF